MAWKSSYSNGTAIVLTIILNGCMSATNAFSLFCRSVNFKRTNSVHSKSLCFSCSSWLLGIYLSLTHFSPLMRICLLPTLTPFDTPNHFDISSTSGRCLNLHITIIPRLQTAKARVWNAKIFCSPPSSLLVTWFSINTFRLRFRLRSKRIKDYVSLRVKWYVPVYYIFLHFVITEYFS